MRIGTIFVVVILVLLIGVVWRIANNDADLAPVLALDALNIFIS